MTERRIGRRALMGAGVVAAAGVALPALGLLRREEPRYGAGPHGGLRPDPDGVLDLLEGFRYRVLERAGGPMDDGLRVPARPDGMACFEVDGALVLTRNHEIPAGVPAFLAGAEPAPPEAYDRDAPGGVTRLVLDPETLERRSSNLLLAGTSMNCAGGPSPWGWLSCEEDPRGIHGFVFLCDPAAASVARPTRIDAYGRFRHEAAGVQPDTGVVYLTEDRPDSCLYRFVPHDPSIPFEGRLYAMRVRGRPGEDTGPLRRGARREIDWVELTRPTPEEDDLRYTAQRLGAAVVRRGEGLAMGDGAAYVCATAGGPARAGQILRLADEGDGGILEVTAASEDPRRLEMPDNVVVGPGGLLYVAEDGPGHDRICAIRPDGEVFTVGRNALGEGEIAGVCFSPDGRALFLNLQEDGLTLVVEGPFAELT